MTFLILDYKPPTLVLFDKTSYVLPSAPDSIMVVLNRDLQFVSIYFYKHSMLPMSAALIFLILPSSSAKPIMQILN